MPAALRLIRGLIIELFCVFAERDQTESTTLVNTQPFFFYPLEICPPVSYPRAVCTNNSQGLECVDVKEKSYSLDNVYV